MVSSPPLGHRSARDRVAERVSAASYGTVLVLAALAAVDADDVESGLGWELITGVGVATWVAHLYAEVLGDHLRHVAAPGRREISHAAADGFLIPLAAVLPASMLLLGRVEVLAARPALWAAVAVAVVQLALVGGFVGRAVSPEGSSVSRYAGATALFGVVVVALKVVLGH